MTSLVLLSLLAADGVVSAPGLEPEREPKVVIDFTPNATAVPFLIGASVGLVLVNVPVSVTWVVGPSTAIYAELVVAYAQQRSRSPAGTFGFSIGPSFSFGPSALQGFFVCPKLGFQISNASTVIFDVQIEASSEHGPLDVGAEWSRAFLTGVDVGYQWTWGSHHLALMIGGSIGYEYDNAGPWVDALGVQRGDSETFGRVPRNQGFAFSFNGNLMRLGLAL